MYNTRILLFGARKKPQDGTEVPKWGKKTKQTGGYCNQHLRVGGTAQSFGIRFSLSKPKKIAQRHEFKAFWP
jgi:hypothetical protein